MKSVKVVIVDDHPAIRFSTKQGLLNDSQMQIVAECETASEIIPALSNTQPDVLLLDMGLSKEKETAIRPITMIKKIADEFPCVKIIVISAHFVLGVIREALDGNVGGYIMKDDFEPEKLAPIIHKVLAGHIHLSKVVKELYYENEHNFPNFTDKQIHIIEVMAEHLELTVEQLAPFFHISKQTLSNYLREIYREMGVKNRTQCNAMAIALGIIQPPNYRDLH